MEQHTQAPRATRPLPAPRPTTDARVETLCELLVRESDLKVIHDHFHEQLASDPVFLRHSERDRFEALEAIVTAGLSAIDPGRSLTGVTTLCYRPARLWHGFAEWGGGLTMFFYPEALGVGLICYAPSLLDPQTHFLRFTTLAEVDGDAPICRRGQA